MPDTDDSTAPSGDRQLPPMTGDGSVLVTGGTGSTGRLLLRWLLEEAGARRVIAFSRDEQKHHDLLQEPEFQHPALHSMVGDIRDGNRLREAMQGISLVLHTAAMKHVPIAEANPSEAYLTNVEGTVNLIRPPAMHESRVSWHSPPQGSRAVVYLPCDQVDDGEIADRGQPAI